MSDKIFNLVKVNSDFVADNPYTEKLIKYCIPHVLSDLSCYWRRDNNSEDIINDDTFGFLWASYPKHREGLLRLAILSYENNDKDRYSYGISDSYSESFIANMYDLMTDTIDLEESRLKARLAQVIDKDFDYLSQVCEYSLNPAHEDLLKMWTKAGMNNSRDHKFYDYLFSKVKREPGSTDKKVCIVKAAHSRGVLSDFIVTKIAKSSPKSLKRAVVHLMSDDLDDRKRTAKRYEGTENEKIWEEIVEKLERKVMLFVGCDDNEIVSNLIDCLSKDNLPWLMPSASKHPWLSRRLEQKIDYLQ